MRYQPQGRLQLARSGLTADISMAVLPGVNPNWDAAGGQANTVTGTRQSAYHDGLSAGFGSSGAANSDKIVTTLGGPMPFARTHFFRARRDGPGGGSLGRLFDKTNGTTGQYMYWWNSNNSLSYAFYGGSTTEASTRVGTTSATATGVWFDFAVTHVYEGGTHRVAVYLNGAQANSSTRNSANTDAPNTVLTLGNRADGTRVWDGVIACAYSWDRELSGDEIASLSENPWQVFEAGEELEETPFVDKPDPSIGVDAPAAGVSATAGVGVPGVSAGAVSAPGGVGASAQRGSAAPSGGASPAPAGVAATTRIGSSASEMSATVPAFGVGAIAQVGSAQVSASAAAEPGGVGASGSTGSAAGQAGASAEVVGVAATGAVGTAKVAAPGAAVYPPPSLVAAGVVYGPNGDDFMGTYAGGGMTDAQDAMLTALAKIHGLVPGVPLVVTQTSRAAGDVMQAITEERGVVTIERA